MNPKLLTLNKENPNAQCAFCFKAQINDIEWGPMYQLEGVTLHYFCMLFSSGLEQAGEDNEGILGFLLEDLREEIRRGQKLRCNICHLKGATIGCCVKQCKLSFHFTCAVSKGTLHQFVDDYFSYCRVHAQKFRQQIPQDVSWECEVCFTTVEDSDDTREGCPVWASCCKKRVFHRYCIQQYAKNAGYFFCCPLCRNVNDFTEAMKRAGVFVPEQDAAWEQEPGAYAELYARHSTCNAEVCQCPKGQTYNSKRYSSPWKLARCCGCGSSAIHHGCGQLESPKWKCPDCVVILDEPDVILDELQSRPSLNNDDAADYTSSEDNVMEPSTSKGVAKVVNDWDTDEQNERNHDGHLSPIASSSSVVGTEHEAEKMDIPVLPPVKVVITDDDDDDDNNNRNVIYKHKNCRMQDSVRSTTPSPTASESATSSLSSSTHATLRSRSSSSSESSASDRRNRFHHNLSPSRTRVAASSSSLSPLSSSTSSSSFDGIASRKKLPASTSSERSSNRKDNNEGKRKTIETSEIMALFQQQFQVLQQKFADRQRPPSEPTVPYNGSKGRRSDEYDDDPSTRKGQETNKINKNRIATATTTSSRNGFQDVDNEYQNILPKTSSPKLNKMYKIPKLSSSATVSSSATNSDEFQIATAKQKSSSFLGPAAGEKQMLKNSN